MVLHEQPWWYTLVVDVGNEVVSSSITQNNRQIVPKRHGYQALNPPNRPQIVPK